MTLFSTLHLACLGTIFTYNSLWISISTFSSFMLLKNVWKIFQNGCTLDCGRKKKCSNWIFRTSFSRIWRWVDTWMYDEWNQSETYFMTSELSKWRFLLDLVLVISYTYLMYSIYLHSIRLFQCLSCFMNIAIDRRSHIFSTMILPFLICVGL